MEKVKMVKCAACAKEMSSQAKACPSCGHPVEGTSTKGAKKKSSMGSEMLALLDMINALGDKVGAFVIRLARKYPKTTLGIFVGFPLVCAIIYFVTPYDLPKEEKPIAASSCAELLAHYAGDRAVFQKNNKDFGFASASKENPNLIHLSGNTILFDTYRAKYECDYNIQSHAAEAVRVLSEDEKTVKLQGSMLK